MFIEIMLAIAIGISAGVFTGLIPGVHINLISTLIFTFSPLLLTLTSPTILCIGIISMAITHTFLDSIPGIYLGAPDEAMALSVLPGHKFLLKGKGHTAVIYTLLGSITTLIVCLCLTPIFMKLMKITYESIKEYVGFLLIIIMSYMILKEKKKLNAFTVFILSGTLGLIVLNFPNLNQPLFPLLSGLFGISMLLMSLLQKSILPKQIISNKIDINKRHLKATTSASIVGFIAAFLPGFGSSQAAIIAQQFTGDIGDDGFLVLVGGINTANMLISLTTAHILNKSRNGAVLIINKFIEEMTKDIFLLLLLSSLIAGSIAFILGINLSKKFCKLIQKVNYNYLITSIIIFILILTIVFDGYIGLLILLTSTAIGIFTSQLGVGKNHLMGCLIIPVILFFVL